MTPKSSADQALLAENAELRARLEEAEESLRAIRSGEVDALVIEAESGPQVFTLQGLDTESNRFRGEILGQISDAVIAFDDDEHVTYLNAAAERLYGVTASEVLGRHFTEVYQPRWPQPEDATQVVEAVHAAGHWQGEYTHVKRDGEIIHVDSSLTLLRATIGNRSGMLAVIRDITGRKQAEAALISNEKRLSDIYNSMSEGLAIHEMICNESGQAVDYRYIDVNPVFEHITGLQRSMVIGQMASVLYGTGEAPYLDTYAGVAATGKPISFEVYFDPLQRHFHISVFSPDTGKFATIFQDITDRKWAEEQIKTSLAEKEVLLSEIHHRVKNNLQVISSLVNLQADSLPDDRLRGVLGDLSARVRTIALVHEKLYQQGDLAQLDIADYAESLLNSLWKSHGTLAGMVRLELALAPLVLPIKTAITCGLILNELASNALKHAFPDCSSGVVTAGLDSDPATGTVCLWVRDNGVGLPEEVEWRQANSLGLRLVRILAGQLGGTLTTGSGPGTEFRVTFAHPGMHS